MEPTSESVFELSTVPTASAAGISTTITNPLVDYTPSKPTEGLFAYDLSFIRQEILGLKRQLHFFKTKNGKLVQDLCRVNERMERLEQENVLLKQRFAENSVSEETSNKISCLEKHVEETKTWAALFKSDDMGSCYELVTSAEP
ncbi:hypothetical protein O6H91_02G002900 [Diphasiastrum complanatum]|uniref:Uncharacterized protein n=1 Tax=Diphasiastrum complanatum TaxID=34168 RepID=A0ACC2ECJ9_DIPCM|nr:hypothetical protein O6H91_02G002900 [Diphasiastrum complanatum]